MKAPAAKAAKAPRVPPAGSHSDAPAEPQRNTLRFTISVTPDTFRMIEEIRKAHGRHWTRSAIFAEAIGLYHRSSDRVRDLIASRAQQDPDPE